VRDLLDIGNSLQLAAVAIAAAAIAARMYENLLSWC